MPSTPAALGFSPLEDGRAHPRTSLGAPPSQNSRTTPSPDPNLFSLATRQSKGCDPGIPALGGEATTPDSSLQPEHKGQRGSGVLPTHLSCGPVSSSGSSDVRVAATRSPRLPRPIPPAAAQQRLLTAHARAAAGGEEAVARGACRAHLRGGAQPPRGALSSEAQLQLRSRPSGTPSGFAPAPLPAVLGPGSWAGRGRLPLY